MFKGAAKAWRILAIFSLLTFVVVFPTTTSMARDSCDTALATFEVSGDEMSLVCETAVAAFEAIHNTANALCEQYGNQSESCRVTRAAAAEALANAYAVCT
jgi:hypothetical protein